MVERKDMQNPVGLVENISRFDLVQLLEKLGIFEEKKPPVLDGNIRIILNGTTQYGCRERIKSVKDFIEQGLIPENVVIDLVTGSRDLWPDGIGGNDSSEYKPDEMLSILLAQRVRKSVEEITQAIAKQREELIKKYQKDDLELTIDNLSSNQKSDLRFDIIKNLKSEFIKLDPEFVWPQESDMFFRLAQENFPSMKVIVHNGVADQNQGRATGVTGLREVALDLMKEIRNNELAGNINLLVIADEGHVQRFSAILFDEIKNAANANNTPDLINSFAFYPSGPSFPKGAFIVSANNLVQNVSRNLLSLVEANFGAINHEMTRNI